jgi:hypothetical protein
MLWPKRQSPASHKTSRALVLLVARGKFELSTRQFAPNQQVSFRLSQLGLASGGICGNLSNSGDMKSQGCVREV